MHAAIKHVDIFSPNHVELLAFFGEAVPDPFQQGWIENLVQVFLASGVGLTGDGLVVRSDLPPHTPLSPLASRPLTDTHIQVVRCANHGALVLSRTLIPTWVPAYWTADGSTTSTDITPSTRHSSASTEPQRHPSVVDTTGAGNCFLGGFAIGYLATGDAVDAAQFGSVSSSFVVEQLGLAGLDVDGAEERWNGEDVWERLEAQLRKGEVVTDADARARVKSLRALVGDLIGTQL